MNPLKAIKNLFGGNLPKAGTVRGKAKDDARAPVNYGRNIGFQTVNDRPIYWLAIQPKGSKKVYDVPVSKKEWENHEEGDEWTADPSAGITGRS